MQNISILLENPISLHQSWCKCKFLLRIDLTSFENLRASNMGSRSSSAVSWGSLNHDLTGIALSVRGGDNVTVKVSDEQKGSRLAIDHKKLCAALKTRQCTCTWSCEHINHTITNLRCKFVHCILRSVPGFSLYAAGELSSINMLDMSTQTVDRSFV